MDHTITNVLRREMSWSYHLQTSPYNTSAFNYFYRSLNPYSLYLSNPLLNQTVNKSRLQFALFVAFVCLCVRPCASSARTNVAHLYIECYGIMSMCEIWRSSYRSNNKTRFTDQARANTVISKPTSSPALRCNIVNQLCLMTLIISNGLFSLKLIFVLS